MPLLRLISRSILCWTTTAHIRPLWSAAGCRNEQDITCTLLPRTPRGSTRSNDGLRSSHSDRSNVARTPAFRNWKQRFGNSSPPTTNSQSHFTGPSPQTKYWHPSPALPVQLSLHMHLILIKEINDSGD